MNRNLAVTSPRVWFARIARALPSLVLIIVLGARPGTAAASAVRPHAGRANGAHRVAASHSHRVDRGIRGAVTIARDGVLVPFTPDEELLGGRDEDERSDPDARTQPILPSPWRPAVETAPTQRVAPPEHSEKSLGFPPNTLINSKFGSPGPPILPPDPPVSTQCEPTLATIGPMEICAWNTDPGAHGGDGIDAAITPVAPGAWSPLTLPKPSGAFYIADPVLTSNAKPPGDVYFSGLVSLPGGMEGISVVHGVPTLGGPMGIGIAWSPAVLVRAGMPPAILFDKEWIVADSSNGNVYLTYTVFGSGTDSILFQRSTDHGATWSTPLTIAAATPALVQGSRPTVGPDGKVYVVWFRSALPADSMLIRSSTDGGLTFGPRSKVATVHSNFGSGGSGSNLFYAPNFPAIAVDRSLAPSRGKVYVTWAEAVDFMSDPLGGGGAVSELAPSGSVFAATMFTPGAKLRGTMATSSDVDTWTFTSLPGTTYVFWVDSLAVGMGMGMGILCPGDSAVSLTQSTVPTGIGSGKSNYVVWTTPTVGPGGVFFLKLFHTTGPTGGYRLETGTHPMPTSPDLPVDQRDIMAAASDDGVTWVGPARVNHDAPGADQLMPEVAVSLEGYAYFMYYDYAGSSCGASTNISLARTTGGGVGSTSGLPVTTTPTEWSKTVTDIAPIQGDYLALTTSTTGLAMAYADGRMGDPDIFGSELMLVPGFGCGGDSAWDAGSTNGATYSFFNPNSMFLNEYEWSVTVDRDWPGMPAGGSVLLPPLTSTPVTTTITVPDTAAAGTVSVCFHLTQPNGVSLGSCCASRTIENVLAVGGGPGHRALSLAMAPPWPNPARGRLTAAFDLPARGGAKLELIDVAGRRAATITVGEMEAGPHVIPISSPGLSPGIYSLRLTQNGHSVVRKVAIVR